MNLLDVSIVHIAIPAIQRNLQASYADVQWALVGYTLAYALVLITGGRLRNGVPHGGWQIGGARTPAIDHRPGGTDHTRMKKPRRHPGALTSPACCRPDRAQEWDGHRTAGRARSVQDALADAGASS